MVERKCPTCGDTYMTGDNKLGSFCSEECMQKYMSISQKEMFEEMIEPKNKYLKTVQTTEIDVYDVLVAFEVTNPAIQHAIKKLLMPGLRGDKSTLQDLNEAKQSIERAMHIEGNPK